MNYLRLHGRKVPLFPLSDFYEGKNLPEISLVDPDEMPQICRNLLVHQNDMTPTLERHFNSRIKLKVIHSVQVGLLYKREVLLVLEKNGQRVEFGAIQIHLSNFIPSHRALILENRIPLGTILHMNRIPHISQPSAYIHVIPDPAILKALGLEQPQPLFGRCNTLKDLDGWPLAEVVEIIPPLTISEEKS
ncbi:MAG: hypothetical protein DIKNOCCD_02293 [bacterium]|nr:hypothetical protein [bacterium]